MLAAAAVLAAALLACTGCTHFENPIVGDSGPRLDPALVGQWSCVEERGSAQIEITPAGDEGHLRITVTEPGKPAESVQGRLITARVEQQTFASLWGDHESEETWTLVRYDLHSPDRLSIYMDNNRFWGDAIRNKLVPGEFRTSGMIQSARVTASSDELRKIIQGYGGVIFDDTAVPCEFVRRTP